uniref:Lipid-binding serum glycoprotein N-terminal domain-containing protein n=1 Tax=Pectinophora gossypiella TaxID=13191 RepID=A0A1E1VXT7_PECGO
MKYFFLSVVLVVPSVCATWGDRARYDNFTEYFPNLIQETVYELERREWSNLRIDDIPVNISERIYDQNFEGTVNFNNGFLVSIQNIDLIDATQTFFTASTSRITTGSMTGNLRFSDVVVGFDVIAHLEDQGTQRFTATFLYHTINYNIRVAKNLHTDEITVTIDQNNLSGTGNFLIFMPDNDIADVLTRYYTMWSVDTSVTRWGTAIIRPIIEELIPKLGFPNVCFNC